MASGPYIVICDSEVRIALAQSSLTPALKEQVLAASAAARNLALLFGAGLSDGDADEMSDVLHWFEKEADKANKDAVLAKVAELISICKQIGGVQE